MSEPQWVTEWKKAEKQPVKPVSENMQRKMNGSIPENKSAKAK